MAEPLGDDLGVDAGLQRQGRVGMAEVVRPDHGQHRLLHRLAKGAAHHFGVVGLTVLLGAEIAAVGPGLAERLLFCRAAWQPAP